MIANAPATSALRAYLNLGVRVGATHIAASAAELAEDGLGYEDISVLLKISKESAWWFVFGKRKTAQ